MRKPEAVIFDMDGVLIDSEPIHYEIEELLFGKLGIEVTEEVHKLYLGAAGDFMYGDLKSRFNLPGSVDELLEFDDSFRCDYFRDLPVVNLNEGVVPLLNSLKLAGLKLAVATSSSPEMVNVLLNKCQIASFFDAIVTTSEAGKSKPGPEVYFLAARKIGVPPEQCMVFEDSPNGITSAKSAGMFCIAVETEMVPIDELLKADFIIKSFSGITADRIIEIFGVTPPSSKSIL
jgi:HAD superfamily hydrolase (TIGR01509 family)